MATIQMYTTASCGYCMAAKGWLARKGFTEIDEVRVDLSPERRDEMIARTHTRHARLPRQRPDTTLGKRSVKAGRLRCR